MINIEALQNDGLKTIIVVQSDVQIKYLATSVYANTNVNFLLVNKVKV